MPKTDAVPESTEKPSSFASRKAEREAREAAGETAGAPRRAGFRAGADAENPLLVVTRVQA